jgi:hypothetical protein
MIGQNLLSEKRLVRKEIGFLSCEGKTKPSFRSTFEKP